ncbi:helix-turn-helix transcriptional regulator [Emcibacter nanhaiensis]|uniref:Helix-turn-helix transcriptional regulator n=1 Tax=Emcibacter nanhaiensis TaxID=1505037 RepID=A0A501PRI1_9PROT|nr:helix-turn-helix transcriptional regulator [Emcibacter nanhaiensis]TPD62727.1 helix-turn-helix transcriptional regulator [Emcibacter nanhaiensis]
MTDITPAQCRAARSMLNWSQADLAKAASVATKTISDFEKGAKNPRPAIMVVIKQAFEAAGLIFLADGETLPGGPGVRLKK